MVSIGIFGTKIGMTQIFDENGFAIPVTVIHAGPCVITQIKNIETDNYNAIQVGYQLKREYQILKPQLGHLKKNNLPPLHFLGEYKVESPDSFKVGQIIRVDSFKIGDLVKINGKTIGKGFSGNQKRHNFKRGPMTHGSKNHRAPGSIGPGSTPGRVFPGKKMAGQLGNKNITISNLKVLGIEITQNLLIIKGSVPGKVGNLLKITRI